MGKIKPGVAVGISLLATAVVAAGAAAGLAYYMSAERKKEVYCVARLANGQPAYLIHSNEAGDVAKLFGATLATSAQMKSAQSAGAQWCFAGWHNDTDNKIINSAYPMQQVVSGCSAQVGLQIGSVTNDLAGVNLYGVKPAVSDAVTGYVVLPWNASKWSQLK